MFTKDTGLRSVQREALLIEDPDVKESGGRVLKEEYDGRYFLVTNNAARSSRSDAGIEKRIVNEIIAKNQRWHRILDPYAGFGISAYIFSKHSERVIALERDWETYSLMKRNLKGIRNVEPVNDDNVLYIENCIKNKSEPPDLIDLDPFGGPEAQFLLALEWMRDGAILCTNGQIEGVYRNSIGIKHLYPWVDKYAGHKATKWAEEVYIPRLRGLAEEKGRELRLVHYYAHPTSLRFVFELGSFEFSKEVKDELSKRPHFLDWFQRVEQPGFSFE
jgi:16S rRNA G966 N2-methylase RsmD